MTRVLVHGNPETSSVWDPVVDRLPDEDLLVLDLPGYGARRPEGFRPTKDNYVDWLIGELERLGDPIHLVGHDWGGAFAVRVACLRPDLVRSWASDALALFAEDFGWHDHARIWQDAEAGPRFAAAALASSEAQVASAFATWGVPEADGAALRRGWTGELWSSVLELYRSANNVGEEWGPDLARASEPPGLAIIPTGESFLDPRCARAAAACAGARVVELPGLDHWWLLQDPTGAADLLQAFWVSLGETV
jgi:pimeloyl-ACP methyl ester carboxylesterase